MHVEWHGQSAFALTASEATVFIDPFGDMRAAKQRGLRFDYPPIDAGEVDLLLVTHEHSDHNGVEAIGGEPQILRSTAGRHELAPVGEVLAIVSEHDEAAGTERGPNTIFAFELDGLRLAHFGDFGQSELREEQATAIGDVDLIFLPVGGGPTIGATAAAAITERLNPRWVVPMHYDTHRTDFLESEEEFVELISRVERLETPAFDTADLGTAGGPIAVVPAAP